MAGLDACLRQGADIIVNTDADNQYCGADIEKAGSSDSDGKADIVIGERPIDDTEHFSPLKKKLQHIGSWTVRVASKTDVPDAPSGFRAYSRQAALKMNVVNEYTYTLETIVQAGRNKMAITSVPIRTNPELRKSRLSIVCSVILKIYADYYKSLYDVQAVEIFHDYRQYYLLIGLI